MSHTFKRCRIYKKLLMDDFTDYVTLLLNPLPPLFGFAMKAESGGTGHTKITQHMYNMHHSCGRCSVKPKELSSSLPAVRDILCLDTSPLLVCVHPHSNLLPIVQNELCIQLLTALSVGRPAEYFTSFLLGKFGCKAYDTLAL